MTDYYSLLEEKLEAVRADPNQSRQTIYDLARYALKNKLFAREQSLSPGQIHDQIILLEMAIALVEANAANRDAIRNRVRSLSSERSPNQRTERNPVPPIERNLASRAEPNPTSITEPISTPPIEPSPIPPTEPNPTPPAEVNASPSAEESNFEVVRSPSRRSDRRRDLVVLPPRNLKRTSPYADDEVADGHYSVPANRGPSITPETLALIQLLASQRKSTPRRVLSWLDGMIRLAVVAAIGFGAYAIWSGNFAKFAGLLSPPPAARDMPATPTVPITPEIAEPSVPRPTVFGVYAIHDGRLIRLEQVTTTPVDARSRDLQQITSPSRSIFPDGRLAFTVYRRDLVNSAPVSVPIRYAARIASMLRFGPAGTLVMSRPDIETWLIYNAGFEFRVLPVPDNREMILIRPDNPDLVLPAGRYVLMLNEQPYDFAVAGNVTDPSSCVEGTPTPRGPVFYQCKTEGNR